MRRVVVRGMFARKLRLTLTALAIVLGVTFVTGTLVLTDTLNKTFDSIVGTAYAHVSFEIRGATTLKGVGATSPDSTATRGTIPASILGSVRRLPGVAFAYGSVSGYAQFIARNGSSIGNGRALGYSFDPNPQLSSLRLVEGRAPTTANAVVMDRSTADKYRFKAGDHVRVLLPGAPQTFTITGIVTFGNDNSLAGATLAGFYLPTAQRLFDSAGRYDAIYVLAAPGSDDVALQRAITRVLPPGIQVVSGQAIQSDLKQTIQNALSFLSDALLVFAFIALFVGAFTIANTFSITIGQRTRELALLRLVGASRRQVFGSVLGEAALTGLIAAAVGLGLGVLAALGLRALLGAFGIVLPSSSLVFEARTPIVALAVGVGVTVLAAVFPARRAVRIPPVAALGDRTGEAAASTGRRLITGMALTLVGIVLVAAGVAKPAIAYVGIGALALFLATAILSPVIAAPLAGSLGRPLARLLGTAGRLGRQNSMRNPRRTAQTAGALTIGLALVSAVAVLGASLSATAKQEVDSAVNADYVISGSGGGGISHTLPAIIARLPFVTATTAVYGGQFDFEDSLSHLGAVSTTGLDRTVNLHITHGSAAPALAAGELLIDSTTAADKHLHVGSVVGVTFARTGSTTIRIGGIYKPNPLAGSYIVGASYFLAHFDHPLVGAVLFSVRDRAPGVAAVLDRAKATYPNLQIQTRAQFQASQQNSVNQLLGLIYVLLALAVIVALIGIVNTLLLSVFERTREIGLLRAVGMRRRQVRTMIRSEAVIVATFGALVGIVVGGALGVALSSALRTSGITTISVPVTSLIAFLVVAALLGLGAATWPARRAAGLDVLGAIATE